MGNSSTAKFGLTVNEVNLGVGFNDVDFSDRVLRLDITPLASSNNFGGENDAEEFGSDLILFKNGMKETQQKDEFTLRINESALTDLLKFMYEKPMDATSEAELVDVLMAADKFESLLKLPISLESALYYLELPSSVPVAQVVQPLFDAANQYFSAHYSNFTDDIDLFIEGPDKRRRWACLQVDSGEAVLDFILKWGRRHYPKLEERREILTKHLLGFVCFPCLSSFKLKEVVDDCPDFEYDKVSKLVLDALFSKIGRLHDPDVLSTCDAFCQGGRRFSLYVHRPRTDDDFCLFVEMTGPGSCAFEYEISVKKKPLKKFQTQCFVTNCTRTETERAKGMCLFKWTEMMSDESVYFIDGILHLQVKLSIKL
ncbi:hypothetical protein V2J09_021990 [Rumex salicifolius]